MRDSSVHSQHRTPKMPGQALSCLGVQAGPDTSCHSQFCPLLIFDPPGPLQEGHRREMTCRGPGFGLGLP